MRKPFAMLFENKVFSIAPNPYQRTPILLDRLTQREGDLFFLSDITLDGVDIPYPIFQYDPMETFLLEEHAMHRKSNAHNLAYAKKLVVDDRIPAFKEFWLEPNMDDEGYAMDSFWISGSRCDLISFIRNSQYSEAIPELREVALHDNSASLRRCALHALTTFDKERIDPIINEILEHATNRDHIKDIALSIRGYSTGECYVPTLRKKFEEYYHDFVDNALALKWYGTIPQVVILACGHIPSIEAFELLEEALRHPYAYVERNARTSISLWIEKVAASGTRDSKLVKKVLEASKKYDVHIMRGPGWDAFKKSPGAEFRF